MEKKYSKQYSLGKNKNYDTDAYKLITKDETGEPIPDMAANPEK